MSGDRDRERARRWVRLYPAHFRARFGADLEDALVDRVRSVRARGGSERQFWVQTAVDSVRGGLTERIRGGAGTTLQTTERGNGMDLLMHQARYAVRTLRRRAGFTLTAVLTIGLGIGASTAIFSVIDAVLLRPLPFPRAEGLQFASALTGTERTSTLLSNVQVEAWRAGANSIDELSVFDTGDVTLHGDGPAQQVAVEVVSPNYFSMLGVEAARGRVLQPGEDRRGSEPVAILSDGLWRTRYGGAPEVLGRRVQVNGVAFTVVGVMPPDFAGVSQTAELWGTIAHISTSGYDMDDANGLWVNALARPAANRTVAEVENELTALSRELGDREATQYSIDVQDLRSLYFARVRPLLFLLFASVLLLLLIACVNVANLQLARATARANEIAVLRALGANDFRLGRLLLLEGLVLGALGAVAGLAFAWIGVRALVPILPAEALPAHVHVELHARSAAFAALLAMLCGSLFGMAGGLVRGTRDLGALLRGARSSAGWRARGRIPAQPLLVVAEVALAVAVLVATGLIGRSFTARMATDSGMAENVIVARVGAPSRERWVSFVQQLIARAEEIPGVEAASLGSDAPLRNRFAGCTVRSAAAPETRVPCYRHHVMPNWFATLGTPLLQGRDFDERDNEASEPTIVLSRSLAARLFPDNAAVGATVLFGNTSHTVIGVAGDVATRSFASRTPEPAHGHDVYLASLQRPGSNADLVVRTSGDPDAVIPALRSLAAEIDADVPLYSIETTRQLVRAQTAVDRMGALLLGAFAALALALAAVGIYGVMAFAVGRRTREIAVRLALGAAPRSIRGMVVREGMLLVAMGSAAGMILAAAMAPLLAGMLFGVRAHDAVTFAVVPLVILAIAFVATLIPAARAAAVTPQTALRAE